MSLNPVWTLWNSEISLVLAGYQTAVHSVAPRCTD
jgi:hypothetical protein